MKTSVIYINIYISHEKQNEKYQQTIKSVDKLYRKKNLQENLIDKNEYASLCKNFTKNLDETKNSSFL